MFCYCNVLFFMNTRPTITTRTVTAFSYPPLCRSWSSASDRAGRRKQGRPSARNALHDRMEERLATMALLGGRDMDIDFMADAEGVGSKQMVMLPDRDEPVELHWGIPSNNREVAQIGLLRSETARIERHCLIKIGRAACREKGRQNG